MNLFLDFRSRSTDEETEPEAAPIVIAEGQSLEDVQEDPESGDSETATEVEISEKTLKFKISTESTIATTGRKSYPGSRKGSRERVQHLNHSDIARMMQKGKLRVGAFSFDQHCMVGNKKLSFDTPEFLHEYSPILKKKFEEVTATKSDSDEENKDKEDEECIVSKETLNLNKRNSEHSVKVPTSIEEKKSILKSNDGKTYSNKEKLKMNNSSQLEDDEMLPSKDDEAPICPNNTRQNSIKNCIEQTLNNSKSDSANSILIQKDEASESKNSSRSLFWRFRQFTDRFGLSMDKDAKTKNSKSASVKNNNCSKGTPHKGKKKLESSCCKSLDEVDVRKASTLPKIKNKKTWKFLALGKDKEGWISEAAVDKLSTDNQSLPSTSNCPSPNFRGGSTAPTSPRKVEPITDNSLGNNVVDKCIVKLHEIQQEEALIVNEKDPNLI